MKKLRTSRSAHSRLSVFLALTLCLAGLSVGATAFAAWPSLTVAAWAGSQKQAAHKAYAEKMEAKHRKWGGASKSAIPARSSTATVPSNPVQTPLSNAPQPNVRQQTNSLGQTVFAISASNFDISPPLTELAKISVPKKPKTQREELPLPPWRTIRSGQRDPVTQVAPQMSNPGGPLAPNAPTAATTGFNFDGLKGNVLESGYPPDNNGSVGNDQFVEMVNSQYQVWSLNRTTKTPTSILGPVDINTLWAGFGGECEAQNSGDPIVLYDKVANRWFLSQFTSDPAANGDFYQCVAVSTTANATGTYARYAFVVPGKDFGDYPHYGVWTDAYYVMAHHFTPDENGDFSFHAASFGAMDRAKMLAGDPTATYQVILDDQEGGHMPADLDGFAPPPAGAPGIFASLQPGGMRIYRLKVDWATPANTARTLQAVVATAPASAACGGTDCIPQPNSVVTLDSLADRLMFRLAYRNFIDHESLVVSHSVDPGIAGVVSGVRWYELRLSGQPDAVCETYPCTYQQGTIADIENGRSRWMSSVSQDGQGNILAGYSTTGKLELTDAHSIRYTGRTRNDPLGTMTVPETIIFTGNRNEVADNTLGILPGRWGDYTSTSIDPADDCTFWHVNQYYQQGNGGNTNFDWSTRIASVSFSAAQCQPTTCTTRPSSAPTIGAAVAIANNQIQVTWTALSPAPGSYAIERAVGAPGSEGLYQPLTAVSGSTTSFIDTTVQGGVTYSYRIIAATDTEGRCQALVRSGVASVTAGGNCTLKPIFAGVTSATSLDGPACGITLSWTAATSGCPLSPIVKYNIYRGTVPDFVPAPANRIATCVPTTSYLDTDALTSGVTYYYVVRAEDSSTGNGGACGGNEDANNVIIAGTAYGAGTQASPGTWTDGGGDGTSFLRLNTEGTNAAWRIIRTAEDPGANHTPGGDYAYRNAGPGPNAIHGDLLCSSAETPVLTVGATTVNLTYWERHQLEKGWDGVAIEYSRNGGAWTDVPAPSNSTADGCTSSDVTGDYATLECTDDPPINACAFPATKPVITGPSLLPAGDCTTYMTGELTNYARRCHRLTGLAVGDTIKFRWKFTSDPATAFKGFYLDDIAVTNISLRNACVPGTPTPLPTPAAQAVNLSTRMRVDLGDNAGIGGFIITGSAPKHVVIRAIGPSLTQFGFPASEVLADPTLELHGPGSFQTVTNNNWRDSQQAAIQASGLAPTNDLEAAIDATLAPGNYTAIVRGNGSGRGIGLVEVYDVETAVSSKLANLSTRAQVGTGSNVVIAGFILGSNLGNDRVVIRGRGPSLAAFGVPNPLQDPTLELRDQNGVLIRSNNDWADDSAQAAEVTAAGLAPTDPRESAIAATLSPGLYTAIMAGRNDTGGIGLVEVYDRGSP